MCKFLFRVLTDVARDPFLKMWRTKEFQFLSEETTANKHYQVILQLYTLICVSSKTAIPLMDSWHS